jgi:hypothetical protein
MIQTDGGLYATKGGCGGFTPPNWAKGGIVQRNSPASVCYSFLDINTSIQLNLPTKVVFRPIFQTLDDNPNCVQSLGWHSGYQSLQDFCSHDLYYISNPFMLIIFLFATNKYVECIFWYPLR